MPAQPDAYVAMLEYTYDSAFGSSEYNMYDSGNRVSGG